MTEGIEGNIDLLAFYIYIVKSGRFAILLRIH